MAPACSNSDAPGLPTCSQNSDCAEPNVCALGHCRASCKSSSDCASGQWCITDPESQSAACVDKDQPCARQRDCTSPLACATDYRCRNLCLDSSDCNVLGVTGRICAVDGNGVKFCADPDDQHGGQITAEPPVAADKSVRIAPPAGVAHDPVGEGGTSAEGGAPNQPAGGSQHGGMGSGGSAGTSNTGGSSGAGKGGDTTEGGTTSGGEGGAAGNGPIVCVPGCAQGKTCVGGDCVPCGSKGQVCCDDMSCGADLTCNGSNLCSCGGGNVPCCGGTSCSSGLSCDKSTPSAPVCTCGSAGTRCCPQDGGGAATCLGDAVCAGLNCSCIAQWALATHPTSASYPQAVVLRTDGTVWHYDNTQGDNQYHLVTKSDQQPLRASAVAVALTQLLSSWHIGCAIVDGGGVWCFPAANEPLTDSTWLGAGLAASDVTDAPVQVVTAVGGSPLTGATQISMSQFLQTPTTCTVANGNVWCWGHGTEGQLGRGDTGNSTFARQVKANASTAFADVAEVRVGSETACARKTDGTVWCWGTNASGELGVSAGKLASSYYPVQIKFTGTAAQKTATRLIAGPNSTYCTVMQDTSVVCWGANDYAQAGAPAGVDPVAPTSVLVSEGGAPLLDVIDLANYNTNGSISTCARTKDLDVLCWGFGNPYPTPFKDGTATSASGVRSNLIGGASLGYTGANGILYMRGEPIPAPSCDPLP